MKTIKSIILISLILLSSLVNADNYKVSTSKSEVKWTGKKVTGEHYGFIQITKGELEMTKNSIVKGSFTIDMNTITVTDLENKSYNTKLVNHLKSEDFFGVESHPEAVLTISSETLFSNNKATVIADLTIKGITHPISFTVVKNANNLTSSIVIDRSKYDVKYRSGSFFDGLGDKLIYDDFTLDVSLELE